MSRRTQKNIKVALSGATGRMGSELASLLRQERHFKLTARVERRDQWGQLSPQNIDVVIDFSTPDGLREALTWCTQHKVPLVSGTTGLSALDKARMARAAKKIPIFYSANMSLGIAVMMSMISHFAAIPDWQFDLEETHHKKKKDKPSGTAKMLARHLNPVVAAGRLKIRSVRRGRVPGIHQITVEGPDEGLEVRHTAHHRRVFARGAIKAAGWLFDKKRAGLYDMSDLYK